MFLPTDRHYVFCDFETTGVDPSIDYPIEVGIVVVNHRLEEKFRYAEMIAWQPLLEAIERAGGDWPELRLEAFKFHKIPASNYVAQARRPELVVGAFMEFMQHHGGLSTPKKPILISDNIWFEVSFMKQLFAASGINYPFHYCGWDTSLLLEMTGVGDVPSNLKAHRALQDTVDMLNAVRESAQYIVKRVKV